MRHILTRRGVLFVLLVSFTLLAVRSPAWLPADARVWLMGNLVLIATMLLLIQRARSHADERAWIVSLIVAVGLFFLGAALVLLGEPGSSTAPVAAQVAYLASYPFLLAGILLALHQHVRHARLIVGLDGVTGALAGAALTTTVIAPLTTRLWSGSADDRIILLFVVGDIGLITASLGALAGVGLRHGRNFAVWAAGMFVFGVGDIVYADRLASRSYEVGTWLDSLWLWGLALVAVGATMRSGAQPRVVPPAKTLVIVLLAPMVAVAVLALAPDWRTDPVPSLLALGALAGGATRFTLAFVQVRELADVREQSLTDELTGIGNRRALYRRLDALLGPAGEGTADAREPAFALALIDLDHFKEVNDSLGHATGDELLKAVVARFTGALDGLGRPYLLTRLGGDEFAVVLEDATTPPAALAAGAALRECLIAPVLLGRTALHVRASVGLALAPEHGSSRGDLLFAADAAMYAAKSSGEPVRLYYPAEAGDRRNRLAVAEELYAAIDRHELTVLYQPIQSPSGRMVALESLVRWDHPLRGQLLPAEFLETAERYRLTLPIAERVLDVTLSDLSRWRRKDPALTASVNISASELRDERIVDVVSAALRRHRLPPESLTVEVTETAMMRDPRKAQTVLQALADLGVELSVDDYGTGYSSLEYLLELPIDEIKLDRAFSASLMQNRRSVAIVRSTVELTHALDLRMVAEGIEDEDQRSILLDMSCDRVQGWQVGRPVPADEFDSLVAQAAPR